jgi:hypothetical protein
MHQKEKTSFMLVKVTQPLNSRQQNNISHEPNKQYNEYNAETIRREYVLCWDEKQASAV